MVPLKPRQWLFRVWAAVKSPKIQGFPEGRSQEIKEKVTESITKRAKDNKNISCHKMLIVHSKMSG